MSRRASFAAASLILSVAIGVADRSDASSCIRLPVSVNEPAGRVFFVEERPGPTPVPGAAVELLRRGTADVVADTTTESDGTFRLAAVRPGTYDLRVSLRGFATSIVYLKVRKRGRELPRGVIVGMEIAPVYACSPACASSPENGTLTSRCLER